MVQTINSYLRKLPAWPIYVAMVAWFAWLFFKALTGLSGPDPVAELEHSLGKIALQVFIAVLAVTPLRRRVGLNLLKFRRAMGLAVFFFVTMHLAVWAFLDLGVWSHIWADIVKRPYITIGMTAFVLMIPLALTSNNYSVRKLGAASWNKLHKLTYVAVVLGAVHNVMVQKVWERGALIYLAIIVILLLMRVKWGRMLSAVLQAGTGSRAA